MFLAGIYLTHKGPWPDVQLTPVLCQALSQGRGHGDRDGPEANHDLDREVLQVGDVGMETDTAHGGSERVVDVEASGVARPSPRGQAAEHGGHPQTPRSSSILLSAPAHPPEAIPPKSWRAGRGGRGGQTT